MHTQIISELSGDALIQTMDRIAQESSAMYVLLAHLSGSVIADSGELPQGSDSTMFAALAAASYSSMASLAILIKEKEFYQMIHLGRDYSLLLYPVNKSSVLVFVVGTGSALKHVRMSLPVWKQELCVLLDDLGGTVRIPQ